MVAYSFLIQKNIALYSGGKDSTATIILAHQKKIPLDLIVFTEVMYDNHRGISGENPEHINFIKEVAFPTFASWGYETKIIRGEVDYLTYFYRIIENPTKHLEHKGMHFGFPIGSRCGIRRDCKVRPMDKFLRTYARMHDNVQIMQYLGICADERKRLAALHKCENKKSLLEQFHVVEEETKELCLSYGLLSPSYDCSNRGGCWFCPWAKYSEHRKLKRDNPQLWLEFCSLEQEKNLAHGKWNPFKETLKERDAYFL